MSHNCAFWKAFHSLVHPLSLIAILLLLFNDHWLRYAHPSWLTGKLGDFTWLVFAPFIAGLLFAWLIPRRLDRQPQWVGILSIGFIGVWFATVKTIPFVHMLTTETLYAIVGWEGQLRLDPTDLLTLPALLISWMIWRQARDSKVSLKPLAYVAFGLGILGTLATSGPSIPDYGVRYVCNTGDSLLIATTDGYGLPRAHQSVNGGLNWHEISSDDYDESTCLNINNMPMQFVWTPTDKIQVSTDGGETWQTDFDLFEQRQEIRYSQRHGGLFDDALVDEPGPFAVTHDTNTGNFIFAMGWDGVLVRQSEGQYTWVEVGFYYLPDTLDTIDPSELASHVFLELCLAVSTVFLVIVSSTTYIRRKLRVYVELWVRASWYMYGFILVLLFLERFDPHSNGLLLFFPFFAGLASLVALFVFAIPLSIGAVWDMLWNFHKVAFNIIFAAIGNGALFIFPFILWTQGRIPRYVFAYGMSMMLTGLGLYATWIYLKRILPTLEPEKEKRDAIGKAKAEEV